jgi:hypothetical protein
MKTRSTVPKEALVPAMPERVADTWTLLVIDALDWRKEPRFSRLRERLGGVSQEMAFAPDRSRSAATSLRDGRPPGASASGPGWATAIAPARF